MIIPGLFKPPVRTLRAIIPENEGSSAYFGIKVWILDFISDKINIKLYRKKES